MLMLWSLFSFKVKKLWRLFPRCNIVFVLSEVSYIFVRYLIESDPRCLRDDL